MSSPTWRVATRRRGSPPGWDIGQTPMLEVQARRKAVEYNRAYPGFEHRAVRIGDKKTVAGGTSRTSPHQGIHGEGRS